jgi:chromosome partitioning protein
MFPVAGLPKPSLHKEWEPLAANYSVVLIDGPPRVYDVARSAIMASDLVLIPVQPSPYDVWAAKEIVDLIHEAAIYKPKLKSAFIINRKIVNTAIGRDVAEALAEYPVQVLHAAISQRVLFAESATQGMTVYELSPGNQAEKEMDVLVDEVKELLA